MISFWSLLCHILNKQLLISEIRHVLYTNILGSCIFILWLETTHPVATYSIHNAPGTTRRVSELKPKLRPHSLTPDLQCVHTRHGSCLLPIAAYVCHLDTSKYTTPNVTLFGLLLFQWKEGFSKVLESLQLCTNNQFGKVFLKNLTKKSLGTPVASLSVFKCQTKGCGELSRNTTGLWWMWTEEMGFRCSVT